MPATTVSPGRLSVARAGRRPASPSPRWTPARRPRDRSRGPRGPLPRSSSITGAGGPPRSRRWRSWGDCPSSTRRRFEPGAARPLVADRFPGEPRLAGPPGPSGRRRGSPYTGARGCRTSSSLPRSVRPTHAARHRDHRAPHLLALQPHPRYARSPAGHRRQRPVPGLRVAQALEPAAPDPDPPGRRGRRPVRPRRGLPAGAARALERIGRVGSLAWLLSPAEQRAAERVA